MYIRFVASWKNGASGRREGIFRVAGQLWRAGWVQPGDYDRYWEIRSWFDRNLDAPNRFTRSRNPRARALGICWFKDSARAHLTHGHELRAIVESYGIFIEMLKTSKPGYITYEDMHQVAACPFYDTPT